MYCDWESYLKILPAWLREDVNRLGAESLQELRLRLGAPPQLILKGERQMLRQIVRQEDLNFCINAASRYSPWAAQTMQEGYLTAPGGHRIGICGEVSGTGFRQIHSLCIRAARDHPGISEKAACLSGSVLILGAPGWGKTTLLRDLIRQRSQRETVAVADERGELFPPGFETGLQTDVLTAVRKPQAILRLLKTMGPQSIAVDEVTSPEDMTALLEACGCGVHLLATAHGSSLEDLKSRPVYRPILQNPVFQHVLILRKDQSYAAERMHL